MLQKGLLQLLFLILDLLWLTNRGKYTVSMVCMDNITSTLESVEFIPFENFIDLEELGKYEWVYLSLSRTKIKLKRVFQLQFLKPIGEVKTVTIISINRRPLMH